MTDQELARALFEAGILTQEQVQTAAAQRSATQNFAQIVVNMGWVSPAQIAQFDPNALGVQTPSPAPPMPAPPPPGHTTSGYDSLSPRVPEVRFGAISEAWQLVTAQMGVWVATMLIYVVAMGVFYAPMYAAMIAAMRNASPGEPPQINPLINLWAYAGGFLVAAIFMPGFFKMALKQIDGYPISVGDIFSGVPYIVNSLVVLILTYIAVGIGVLACCIGSIVAGVGLCFAIPLVVDKAMSPLEALGESWNTLKSHLFMMFALLFVTYLCVMLGYLACGIGVLVTGPLGFITPMIVYRDFFPASGNRPQDQGNYTPPPIPSPF
jgi:hypothetical protein